MLDFLKPDGRNLVLFVSGYGQDLNTFKRFVTSLPQDTAFAILYDYEDDEVFFDTSVLECFSKIRVIAWSMGVMMAPLLLQNMDKKCFEKCIAVNGTLDGIDDEYGIPKAVWDETISSMDDEHALNFIKLMCRSPALIEEYLKDRPKRSVASLKRELIYIRDLAEEMNAISQIAANLGAKLPKSKGATFYDKAYSSKRDLIMPHAAVLKSFERLGIECEPIAGAHFVPDLFESLIAEPFTHAK